MGSWNGRSGKTGEKVVRAETRCTRTLGVRVDLDAVLDCLGFLFQVEGGKKDGVYVALGHGIGFMQVAFWENMAAAQDEILKTVVKVVMKDVCHINWVWTVGR